MACGAVARQARSLALEPIGQAGPGRQGLGDMGNTHIPEVLGNNRRMRETVVEPAGSAVRSQAVVVVVEMVDPSIPTVTGVVDVVAAGAVVGMDGITMAPPPAVTGGWTGKRGSATVSTASGMIVDVVGIVVGTVGGISAAIPTATTTITATASPSVPPTTDSAFRTGQYPTRGEKQADRKGHCDSFHGEHSPGQHSPSHLLYYRRSNSPKSYPGVFSPETLILAYSFPSIYCIPSEDPPLRRYLLPAARNRRVRASAVWRSMFTISLRAC